MNRSLERAFGLFERARTFFTRTLWETPLSTLGPAARRRYGMLRVATVTADGLFVSDVLPFRAAALTYYTVLSIVPLLAFTFAVLKGFGAYDALVEETLRPYLWSSLARNSALRQAANQVLDFVSQTGVASLGFVGLVLVLYSAARLLRNVETALNDSFNIAQPRSVTEQLRDYSTIIVVTPLCLLLAAGLGTAAQVSEVVRNVQHALGIGGLLDAVLRNLSPLFVIVVGLYALYELMPHTDVASRSALLGAFVGGLLWYGFLLLHVNFQVGVARYNALYSSFAAIPVFLVWIYVSWLSVLVGAEVSATHQRGGRHPASVTWKAMPPVERQQLALAVMLEVARGFTRDEPGPVPLARLAERVGVSVGLLSHVVQTLADRELLLVARGPEGAWITPSRHPDRILVADVLAALHGEPQETAPDRGPPSRLAASLVAQLAADARRSGANLPLGVLVAQLDCDDGAEATSSARSDGRGDARPAGATAQVSRRATES